MSFKGLVYMKHGRVGTRSEGPDYWLQTSNGEYMLHFHDRHLWEPDFELEFYNRHLVEVEGKLNEKAIRVTRIWVLPVSYIPREDTRPHLGDAILTRARFAPGIVAPPVQPAAHGVHDHKAAVGSLHREHTLPPATPSSPAPRRSRIRPTAKLS